MRPGARQIAKYGWLLLTAASLITMAMQAVAEVNNNPTLIELKTKQYVIRLDFEMRLSAIDKGGSVAWASSTSPGPFVTVKTKSGNQNFDLALAKSKIVEDWSDGAYKGKAVELFSFEGTDVKVQLGLARGPQDELLVQVSQVGGSDELISAHNLFRFEKPVSDGGYMVLSHGSGYLVPADCPDDLPGSGDHSGMIGGRWSMPLFGMVKGHDSLMAVADTWWDCFVAAEHVPGKLSAMEFNWYPSLGKFAYPRRLLLRFAKDLDYTGMAKIYRKQARKQGLVRTLREKARVTPQIRKYVDGVLVRWAAWNQDQRQTALSQFKTLKDAGIKLNVFFPKWPSQGYTEGRNTATTSDGIWQGYLSDDPVPGGWPSLVGFNDKLHEMGCLTQGMINPGYMNAGAPGYDPTLYTMGADGKRGTWAIWASKALERNKAAVANLKKYGLNLDLLYYDTYSAAAGIEEDFDPARRITRRAAYEAENACFANTRDNGIMPGAELARFWAIGDSDFFFFTDWSADRLSSKPNKNSPGPVGEPIPLFELVFHDCYVAGFSGGGYGLYNPGFDWWPDKTPRLYELLFVSAPCHNWLPNGYFPMPDTTGLGTNERWQWLNKMAALCKATKYSEMTSHEFTSPDRKQQRVKFANGVVAEFDFAKNQYKITGAPGFTGDWETPPSL